MRSIEPSDFGPPGGGLRAFTEGLLLRLAHDTGGAVYEEGARSSESWGRYESRTGAGDIRRISKRGCDMRTTGLRFTFVQIAKCKAGLPGLVIDNKPRPRKHSHIVANGLNGASSAFMHFSKRLQFKEFQDFAKRPGAAFQVQTS